MASPSVESRPGNQAGMQRALRLALLALVLPAAWGCPPPAPTVQAYARLDRRELQPDDDLVIRTSYDVSRVQQPPGLGKPEAEIIIKRPDGSSVAFTPQGQLRQYGTDDLSYDDRQPVAIPVSAFYAGAGTYRMDTRLYFHRGGGLMGVVAAARQLVFTVKAQSDGKGRPGRRPPEALERRDE